MADKSIYIILGSNIGDKKHYIDSACVEIEQFIGSISESSSYYQTSPWGFDSDDEFLNKVVCVRSSLDSYFIMDVLLEIENKLGRVRDVDVKGYQSRTIDLDILLIDNLIIESDKLMIPHPRMNNRKFVLVPLSEIAGKLIHPKEMKSINYLLNVCDDKEDVIKVF